VEAGGRILAKISAERTAENPTFWTSVEGWNCVQAAIELRNDKSTCSTAENVGPSRANYHVHSLGKH